ncbi:unnamed protein product [Rhizophagus irregularis]|nr:hypothetical protein RhiirB3_512149 [Rhizophagus irregularis]CAB5206333.1 unnamed protein product [Rhizophagus irregularis]
MPVEIKTRYNLHLRGYNFWEIYRSADRRNIRDPNFKFKKRILSQIFGEMACIGLHYGILSNYTDTYFLMRQEADPNTLYVSRVFRPGDTNPTLRECVYYISQLAINDVIGLRLGCVLQDNDSSNNDDSDDSSGGSFGQVFSGFYDNQAVAWKTCDTYKRQEEMKTLKHEAHIYSVLKECQGRVIPRLFYKGYIYDRCLFALALQLIEDSHYIDPTILTKEEKELIVNQLKSIHNFGVLHNDISNNNILYEPKSHQFFFIDFCLSEIVDNESPKLRKEEKRLKKLLQL